MRSRFFVPISAVGVIVVASVLAFGNKVKPSEEYRVEVSGVNFADNGTDPSGAAIASYLNSQLSGVKNLGFLLREVGACKWVSPTSPQFVDARGNKTYWRLEIILGDAGVDIVGQRGPNGKRWTPLLKIRMDAAVFNGRNPTNCTIHANPKFHRTQSNYVNLPAVGTCVVNP